MAEYIDPKHFGITGRTLIEKNGPDSYAIVIERKSRIIMADGRKIAEKVKKIMDAEPTATVSLKCSAPICSKTCAFLSELGIDIVEA